MLHGFGLTEDKPSVKDFKATDIFGSTPIFTPEKVDLDDGILYDQNGSGKCTAYAMTAYKAILDNIEHKAFWKFNAEEQWTNQMVNSNRPVTDNGSDNLQNALASLKRFGLTYEGKVFKIAGYANIDNSVIAWKRQLTFGFPIFTGIIVTETNFAYTDTYGVLGLFDSKQTDAHCILGVGYDDNYDCTNISGQNFGTGAFRFKNSWGEWGKLKGYYYIPYSIFEKQPNWLFSSYIVYDEKDIMDKTFIFTDVTTDSPHAEDIQFVKDKGLMTGEQDGKFSPDRPMTRREFAIVARRLYKLLHPEA